MAESVGPAAAGWGAVVSSTEFDYRKQVGAHGAGLFRVVPHAILKGSARYSEDDGGGSLSGQGLVDLTLVAYEFGRHAAPGPLADTNIVCAALTAQSGDLHKAALADLLSGTAVASWCVGRTAMAARMARPSTSARMVAM